MELKMSTIQLATLFVYFVGWVIISYRAEVKFKQALFKSIAIGAIWPILFVLVIIEVASMRLFAKYRVRHVMDEHGDNYLVQKKVKGKWVTCFSDSDELSAIRKAKYVAKEAAKRKEKTIWRG